MMDPSIGCPRARRFGWEPGLPIPGVVRSGAAAASKAVAGLGHGYRVVVTTGRWGIVVFWIAVVAVLPILAPPHQGGGGFGEFLPEDHPIIQAQLKVLEEFAVPVLSGTTVVVHQPGGLSLLTRTDSYLWALATTQDNLQGRTPPGPDQVIAAIPVPTGRADTTVTYLYGSEGTGIVGMARLGDQYAAHFQNQSAVQTYVTGFVPAQVAQGDYLNARIGLFEVASLILILLVVALAFRSLLAPLVVVGIAAVGYLTYLPVLTIVATALGFEVPGQLEPVLLALLLGVVTDYCVLFFHTLRDEIDTGADNLTGARAAVRHNASIIAVAGLTVAGGTISLLAAPFEIFRALGPALALTVLVGVVLSLTLTPALMTIFGWRLFSVIPVRGSGRAHLKGPAAAIPAQLERRESTLVNRLTRRGPALVATAVVLVALGAAALPLTQARFDLSFASGLPREDSVAEGAALLDEVGLRGITAPTEVVLNQPGIAGQRAALIQMQTALAGQPGVARVIGPADSPFTDPRGVVLAENGNAARYVVIFDSDPLAARAIDDLHALEANAESLARESGLADRRDHHHRPDGDRRRGRRTHPAEPGGRPGHRAARRTRDLDLLPAGTGSPRGLVGLQRPQRRGRARPDHAALPGPAGTTRPHLLRPVRRRRLVDRPRLGLQRLRRRPDLAGGRPPPPGGGHLDRGPPLVARHHPCGSDSGCYVRFGGDHPVVDVPSDRLRHDRRTAARHPRRPADPHPSRADPARTIGRMAGKTHHDQATRSGSPGD